MSSLKREALLWGIIMIGTFGVGYIFFEVAKAISQ